MYVHLLTLVVLNKNGMQQDNEKPLLLKYGYIDIYYQIQKNCIKI